MIGISLHEAAVDPVRCQAGEAAIAIVITSNPTDHRSLHAEAGNMAGHISGRTAPDRRIREEIPKGLANGNHSGVTRRMGVHGAENVRCPWQDTRCHADIAVA